MASAPLLSVQSLRHAYGKHVVFDSISFDVAAGSALALVGKNGSGKSTLLRCVTGSEERSGGSVRYDGAAYDETSPRIRREVATVASRASATWLLATPVDRRGLLVRQLTAMLAGGGASSTTWFAASSGAFAGLALVAAAVVAQPFSSARRALTAACDVLLVVAVMSVPLFLLGIGLPSASWNRPLPLLIVTALAAVAAVLLVVRAYRGLRTIPRREMVAGGGLLSGLAGAAVSLDTSLISDLLISRRFRTLGARPSRTGQASGLIAVAVRETQRWLRSPHRITIAIGLLIVPYAAARIGVPSAMPIAAAVAGYLALRPFAGGLHTIARSPGLRRSLPYDDIPLRLTWSAPVLAVALLWSLAISPALPDHTPWVAGWLALAAAISAGVFRSATRKPVSFDGPLISTPAGALPAGFIAQLLRGPDFLLIGVALLTLGLWWQAAVLVPAGLLAYAVWKG